MKSAFLPKCAAGAASLCLVLLLATVPAGAADWAGQQVTRDGTPHLMNPAQPIEEPSVLTPEKLWEVKGDEDDEFFFGVISQIASDRGGDIFLLDAQLNEVMIFSPDGEYIRSIGREGEGPGEFRRPSGLFLTGDGNVAVMQRMPGKIVLLTPDGEPIGDHPMPESKDGGMRMFMDGKSAGSQLVLVAIEMARKEAGFEMKTMLMGVNAKGEETATFFTMNDERNFANMNFDEKKLGTGPLVWVTDDNGRVYTSVDFDAYSINVWSPDGTLERVIEREYTHRVRSEEERERNKPRIRMRRRTQTVDPEVKASKTDRDVQEIHPRSDGTLWVLSSKGAFDADDGTIATFDVFDHEGRFARQVTLQGVGDYADDGFHIVHNRLYVVRGFRDAQRAMRGGRDEEEAEVTDEDAEPMSVICYDIGPIVFSGK